MKRHAVALWLADWCFGCGHWAPLNPSTFWCQDCYDTWSTDARSTHAAARH